ncbi:hypothetical protein ACGFNU_21300 [Spirillospora sp. NPDC048911]|uniref:hypothetical protein n=1 Tax=Spirillospora sp. NPDC048911 TaxID=3364527 RepID=UPI0037144B72
MAGQTVRYEPNIPGLGRIMRSRGMQAMLSGEAQRGRQYAEVIAPRDTGDYAASFRVTSASRGSGRWSDRAAGYLYNDSDHALAVEFQDDYRTLGIVADIIENGA